MPSSRAPVEGRTTAAIDAADAGDAVAVVAVAGEGAVASFDVAASVAETVSDDDYGCGTVPVVRQCPSGRQVRSWTAVRRVMGVLEDLQTDWAFSMAPCRSYQRQMKTTYLSRVFNKDS